MASIGEVVLNPVFFAPLIGLIGVLVGQVVGGWSKKKEHQLNTMQASVTVLQAEYNRLSGEIRELRTELNTEKRNKVLTSKKYSASIAYIELLYFTAKKVFWDLDQRSVPHEAFPAPPEIIKDDLPFDIKY